MSAHDDDEAGAAVPPALEPAPPTPPAPEPAPPETPTTPAPPAPVPPGSPAPSPLASPAPVRPRRRPLGPPDLDALDFILDVFIPEAQARGLAVPSVTEVRPLLDDLAAEARAAGLAGPYGSPAPAWGGRPAPAPGGWGAPSGRPSPATLAPATLPPATLRPTTPRPPMPPAGPGRPDVPATALPGAFPSPAPGPVPGPASAGRPTWSVPAGPPRPSPVREWWDRVRAAVGSDLGVHGLAYLGVLLLFVGVFGLVAFAFGEVTPSLRPVAELAVAVVPFVGARLLLGHGAAVAGRALEVTGGLLLPLMLVTSQVDGYPVPPNPRGAALVVGLTGVCLACAGAFAAWSARHAASGLRYAVAPVLWLAAAMATIGVGRPLPAGQDVAVPSSAQTAAMALALVATLAVAGRGEGALATATRAAARPGIVVVAVLTVLTWSADGAPAVPVAVGGLALLAALELLRPEVPDDLADVVGPVWVGGAALAVGAGAATQAPAAAGAAVVLAALVERAGRRGAPGRVLALPAAGVAVALAALWPASWWTVGTVAAATAWTIARRVRPFEASGSTQALDASAAVLPAVLAGAVGAVTEPWLGVVTATVLVVAATLPAALPATRAATSDARSWALLRRGSTDAFWVLWWRAALACAALVALATWPEATATGRWAAVLALVALGAVAGVGPVSGLVRPWAGAGLLGGAWLTGALTADVPAWLRGGGLALAALAMVVAARTRPARATSGAAPDGGPAVSLGAAGHVLGLVAVTAAGAGWALVGAAAFAVAGWAVTAVRGELADRGEVADGDPAARADLADAARRTGSGVSGALAAVGLGHLPWAVVAVGLPGVVWLALDAAGVLAADDPWRVGVPAGTAVAYAVVSRLLPLARPRLVAGVVATAAAVAAPALATGPWTAVVGLGALVAAVPVLPRDLRRAPTVWLAWLAVAPLAGLLADRLWPAFRELPTASEVSWALAAAGSALVVGGTAVLGARRPLGDVDPARGVGVVDLAAALTAAVVAVPQPDAGRIVLVVSAAALVLAVQLGLGALAGAALLGAWGGVVSLAWPGLDRAPGVSVAVAAALVVAAEVLHRVVRGRTGAHRWDLPVLAAAAAPAVTALAAADGSAVTPTYVAVGLLTVVVALRVRAAVVPEVLGAVGSALVLAGAGAAGTGWLALALLGLAGAHTGLAVPARGGVRTARQVVGVVAAVAAWGAAIDWSSLAARPAVDLTAGVAGGVVLAAGALARVRRLDRSWSLVWGGAGLAVLVTAVGAALSERIGVGPTVVAAVAAVAPAALLAAQPLRLPGLRDVAAGALLGAVLLALAATSADGPVAVLVLGALGVVTAGAAVPLAGRPAVMRPLAEVSGGATLAAGVWALAALPDPALAVPVLAVAAVQAAALGVAARSLGLRVASPVLGCAAWLGAVAAPERAPEWYTVAVGLTLLVVVAIWRRDLRTRGLPPGPAEVAATDLVGIALLVVASLVRAVSASPAHAAVAVAIGVAVALWGVVTRVRRRLAAGVVVVGTAVVLLVGVPLVGLLPSWSGAGGWLLLAGLGLVAVLAATFMERGRTVVRSAAGRVERLTTGWE